MYEEFENKSLPLGRQNVAQIMSEKKLGIGMKMFCLNDLHISNYKIGIIVGGKGEPKSPTHVRNEVQRYCRRYGKPYVGYKNGKKIGSNLEHLDKLFSSYKVKK